VLRDAELVELKGFYDKRLIQLNDYMKFVASFYHYDLSACNETFSNSKIFKTSECITSKFSNCSSRSTGGF